MELNILLIWKNGLNNLRNRDMRQTAVEWLVQEISTKLGTNDLLDDLYKQAKEMEKEQIIDAHDAAYTAMNLAFRGFDRSVEYYEETYKK